jgi:DNA-binding response OmpR family regulator
MVYRFGGGVQLTQAEMDLFEALYDAGARGLTIEQMLDALYGHKPECDQPEGGSNIISVIMSRLRPKLRKIGLFITSGTRGHGGSIYRLMKMRALSPEHAKSMEAAR